MDAEESNSETFRFFGNLIIIATKNFTLLGLMLIGSLYDRLHEDDLQLSPAIIFICFGIISGICIFQVLLQAVYYSNDFVFTKVWQSYHIFNYHHYIDHHDLLFSLSLILELISFHIYQILLWVAWLLQLDVTFILQLIFMRTNLQWNAVFIWIQQIFFPQFRREEVF